MAIASVSLGALAVVLTGIGLFKARTLVLSPRSDLREIQTRGKVERAEIANVLAEQADVNRKTTRWLILGAAMQLLASVLGLWALMAN